MQITTSEPRRDVFPTAIGQESLEVLIRKKVESTFNDVPLHHFDELHALITKPADKVIVQYVLGRTGGNQVHAAKILGINRNTLRKKMKIYGIGKERHEL